MKNPRTTSWIAATLAACAALITIFLVMYFELPTGIGATLRAQGANAVVYPDMQIDGANDSDKWNVLDTQVRQVSGTMLRTTAHVGTVQGKPVMVVAADSGKLLEMMPYWSISGSRDLGKGDCFAGTRLAELLKLRSGTILEIHFDQGHTMDYRVKGIIDSGDEDDWKVFVPELPSAFQREESSYALLSIPAGEKGIEQLEKHLDSTNQSLRIKTLTQVVQGEKIILKKVVLLSGLSLMIVVILTFLGVSFSAVARMVERRKELALMQSLGARRWSVLRLLLLENSLVGIAASAIGSGFGFFVAHFLFREIFHLQVGVDFLTFFVTVIAATSVAVLTGCVAAVRALNLQPAMALRGE